jgi:pimeloyl-ACP methyl ester carboxylesterase
MDAPPDEPDRELPDLGQLPERFDALGTRRTGNRGAIHSLTLPGGRVARYIDEGDRDWRSVVFFGGFGTSVGAFCLTEFARSLRLTLRLRVISVERNGFGETPLHSSLGYDDAADDVLSVLAALGIERFAIVAFSGGGPYAAALAVRTPARVISLHLAAAAAGSLTAAVGTAAAAYGDATALARDPRAMWRSPARSPVHAIPGFVRAAGDEGVRALGQGEGGATGAPGVNWPSEAPGAPSAHGAGALAHDWHLLSTGLLPDLDAVRAPAYLYWGTRDDVVPPVHAEAWRRALPNVVAQRCYDGEGHDVQYRHWDQILVDAALADSLTMICLHGRTRLVPDADVPGHLAAGATVGLCAWAHHGEAGSAQPKLEAA